MLNKGLYDIIFLYNYIIQIGVSKIFLLYLLPFIYENAITIHVDPIPYKWQQLHFKLLTF